MKNRLLLSGLAGLTILTVVGCGNTKALTGGNSSSTVPNQTATSTVTNTTPTNTARNTTKPVSSQVGTESTSTVSVTKPSAKGISAFSIPSIKSLTIQADTAAGTVWSPITQQSTNSKVYSLLKDGSVTTTVQIPKQPVGLRFNANISPSRLSIVTTTGGQISIYPAFYIAKGNVDQNGNQLYTTKFVQNVVEVNQNGEVTYLSDKPLYTWLKNNQWRANFSSSVHQ
ncbi:hypothetical protein LLE49_07360 [Alicyclobacillus tolerans]|uniref:hypothetical protein n=1 Tax=Alicyclobacillus tolerans TaxID=90970 RepID=UPI001F1838CC|nr:hypothetical protein [Alicyclobacillus tolerans]MCF8564561.1 hypothetical protein [Alicyclobacillus tolerans]